RWPRDWSSDVCSSDLEWVNGKLRRLVNQVPEERLTESFGASFDTIKGTYAHILRGQIYYYTRWAQGDRPPQTDDLQSIAEIERRSEERRVGKGCRSRG